MKEKINRALDDTIAELDETYLKVNITGFLRDLDTLVVAAILSDSGIKQLKRVVADHQEFVLDYSFQFLANLSLQGVTRDNLKDIVRNLLKLYTPSNIIDDNVRKLMTPKDAVIEDTILSVLVITKLNIKRAITLVDKYTT